MLMMLGVGVEKMLGEGATGAKKGGPADAHNARVARGKKEAQLMFMMLGRGAASRKKAAQLRSSTA